MFKLGAYNDDFFFRKLGTFVIYKQKYFSENPRAILSKEHEVDITIDQNN